MSIISVSQYKAYAGISASTWDTQLGIIITATQDTLEKICGRRFDTATYTEYVDGANSPTVYVQNAPITSVTSVALINRAETVVYTYDATGYKVDLEAGLISRQVGGFAGGYDNRMPLNGPTAFERVPQFPDGWQNVKIVYVGGYSSQTMPTSLQLLMYNLTACEFAVAGADLTLKSESLGHYAYTRSDGTHWQRFAQEINAWKRVIQ